MGFDRGTPLGEPHASPRPTHGRDDRQIPGHAERLCPLRSRGDLSSVIYEEVHITVDPDRREEFVRVYRQAWKDAAFEGSHLGKIMRAIEHDDKIGVLIEWDDLAA